MKIKTTTSLLIFSILATLSLSNGFAQYAPHMQVGLPEGAIARLGTGPFNDFRPTFAYSPNAKNPQLAVPGLIGIWLYDAETLQARDLLSKPYPNVVSMNYSPDGNTLVTGYYDGNIDLWDVATGELRKTITPHPSIAYWDESAGHWRHNFSRFRRFATSVSFSPDGTILAAGIDNGTIEFWNATTGEFHKILDGHHETIDNPAEMGVSFSNDGTTLASTSKYSEVHLWDVATGKLRKTLGRQSGGTESVSFSPDGNTMATYNSYGTIHLWNVATYELIQTFEKPVELIDQINLNANITFSPDGSTIVTYSHNTISRKRALYLWDVPTGTIRDILNGPYSCVEHMSYSPDGNTLAVLTNQGVFIWDVIKREIRDRIKEEILNPHSAISPDGETLATGHLLWDISIGAIRNYSLEGHIGFIRDVSFSPDGKSLAIAVYNWVYLWDVPTGTLRNIFKGHTDTVMSVEFSPDSSTVASGSVYFQPDYLLTEPATSTLNTNMEQKKKGELLLWDVSTGQQKNNFMKHVGNVYSISFNFDNSYLAVASDNNVYLLDAVTGETSKFFPNPGNVYSVSFSPDGNSIATGSDDKVRLWDITTGTIRTFDTIFNDHTPNIRSVKFSPDGRTLAASIYNTVHLWDIATSDTITVFKGHAADVYRVNFNDDGTILASGSIDGTLLLWEVRVSKQLKEDINDDSVVNIQDLVLVAAQFGQTGDNKEDVNGDGVVNIKDLVLVAAAFRKD